MKLYAYKVGSESSKALAEALGIKRIKHEGKKLQVKGGILNWGASAFKRDLAHDGVLNIPDRVAVAGNKLETFKALQGYVTIPEWTESQEEASKWLADGSVVVARATLTGHSGQGITIYDKKGEIEKAPLYTMYIPKQDEYRIHVVDGEVIHVQRKARKKDVPDDKINWKVRNHANGFVFAHEGVVVPDEAKKAGIMAVDLLGLDFGAVDIIFNAKRNKWYVLEINTAPGLEGTTLQRYADAFRKKMA